ncbi:MAG TPA: phosphotransferase [Candidatus Saccharimonadales bacterium]|nr:phosphotransferase [Candidatus Saccharimonadales bacterium]
MTLLTNTELDELGVCEVVSAYFVEPPRHVKPCDDGIINTTYLLQFNDGRQCILQQLNTLFDEATVTDFQAVSTHLAQRGRIVQRLIPTIGNKPCYRDSAGNLWRALSYIAGTEAPEHMTESQLVSVGKLLGGLHESLSSFTYKPTFTIPNFHDTGFYARTLGTIRKQVLDPALQRMADDCLAAHTYLELPPAPMQLIHGDPRTTNIVFDTHTELASCYIDFDTLMYGSPWVDIGDLIRSISGNSDQTQEKFSIGSVQAIMQGYILARPQIAPAHEEALRLSLTSLQVISIELTIRFLIDTVQDYYFGWDNTLFQSRKDNNIARANAQLAIYRKATEYLSGI